MAANVTLPLGEGIRRIDVETSAELSVAVRSAATQARVVIMAAAVADFRPAVVSATKIKKRGSAITLELVPTEDILAGLVRDRTDGQVIVGFAAETGDDDGSVLDHGRAKARRKGADLLVVNAVGEGIGFGDVDNAVTMVDAAGEQVASRTGSKLTVAHAILDRLSSLLAT